ncbi:hypothetical protein ACFV8Z_03090 [Streptomyces sp. NPDC059837]|uniref:effector-associated constant component EACC1 n=1 Tax=Streptomyces sp. NPDC059837 TaxID=3346968 RepID=UPI00364636B4
MSTSRSRTPRTVRPRQVSGSARGNDLPEEAYRTDCPTAQSPYGRTQREGDTVTKRTAEQGQPHPQCADAGQDSLPVPGEKGGVSALLLAPGAPSVAWAVVKLVELWLRRDRSRSMTITVQRDGSDELTVNVSGEQISTQALEAGIAKAFGDTEDAETSEAAKTSEEDDASEDTTDET